MNKLYLVLLLIFSGSCSTIEDPPTMELTTNKIVSLSEDSKLQNLFPKVRSTSKRYTSSDEKENILSKVNWERVRRIDQPDLYRVIYAAANSENVFTEDYLENLIIYKVNGTENTYVIRYEAVEDWFLDKTLTKNFNEYLGYIKMISLEGELLAYTYLENGVSKKPLTSSAAYEEPTCDIWFEVTYTEFESCGSYCTEFILYSYWDYTPCDDNGTPVDAIEPSPGYGGGGGGTSYGPAIPLLDPIDLLSVDVMRNKPIAEYKNNKCLGTQKIWNGYPENEVSDYITMDGSLLVTDITGYYDGVVSGTYQYDGVTYYPYLARQGAPANNCPGMVQAAGHYLIPVVASVHTRSPCRSDGTDGTSHNVGTDDKNRATKNPNINHWVIGCSSVAQYNGTNNSFFNKQSGNLSSICTSIK